MEILTAKKIETLLYNDYPHLLEKYFGISIQKRSTVTGRNLIQRAEKGKKLVEKHLLDHDVSFVQRWKTPESIFIDTELIILSHEANKLKHRYENPDLYNKVFPFKLHDGGIDCIVMAYAEIAYDPKSHTWRPKKKTEQIADGELLYDCEVIQFLPFYNIVSIEDGDGYFSCHIIHCDASPVYKGYEKVSYRYQTRYGSVIFDYDNALTAEDLSILENDKAI